MTRHQSQKYAATVAGIGLSLLFALPAQAQIAQVSYDALTGPQIVTFAAVPGGTAPGTNYDNILVVNGVAFAERFAGQSVTANGNFDVLSGTPTAELTLVPGDAAHNLSVFTGPAGPVLNGLGTQGFPVGDAIGEGAVSILFSSDQSEFGFRYGGGNGANIFLSFFRADGSLIQSITLAGIPLVGSYGFIRDGGVQDIRGVSIWNNDPTGFGFSAFRHNIPSAVPEPGTWAMMLLGFAMIGWTIRDRSRTAHPKIGTGPATAV